MIGTNQAIILGLPQVAPAGGLDFTKYNLFFDTPDTTALPIDASPKGNNAATNTATFVNEGFGHYSLDYFADLTAVTYNPDSSLADNSAQGWTIGAWVRHTSVGAYQDVIRLDVGGGGYLLRINDGATLFSLFNTTSGAQLAYGGALTVNTWQLMLVTANLSTGVIDHYINNVKAYTTSLVGAAFNFTQNIGVAIGQAGSNSATPTAAGEDLRGKILAPFIAPQYFAQADVDTHYTATKGWLGL
jgi:hypothetical protein